MAATVYLFLLTLSFASGTFFPVNQNGSPIKIHSKRSYQSSYHFSYPEFPINPKTFWDVCRLRRFSTFECYLKLENILRREDPESKFERNALKSNTRNVIPGILNENNKQIDKPESYINSILDEDKRDVSNFNASDNVLNSTWIEIKDPRKTVTPINSEIANAKETDEFVSFQNENIVNGEKADPSFAENNGNKTNSRATDDSNTDGETATEIQQTTTAGTIDVVNSGIMGERTTIRGETSDVTRTKEVTEGTTTLNPDLILTGKIDEENKENSKDQTNTTGLSSSENAEKITTADLNTDSSKFGFKEAIENTAAKKTDTEVTTQKRTEDKFFPSEENFPTESPSTSTSVLPEDFQNDTTLATSDFTASTVFKTTLLTNPTKSESVIVSDADISPSSKTESETSSSTAAFPSVSVTESFGYKTESSTDGFTSTMITDSKSSNSDFITKSIPVVHEHTINIRSIKIAKIVLSVLLLVTGLIAVVLLAVYLFRVRRGAVQYDQLTLLP